MPLLKSFFRCTRGTQLPNHSFRKQFAKRGRLVGVRPGHLRPSPVVHEIFESKAKIFSASIRVKPHYVPKGFELLRLAVRRQAHHFVFVAKFQESEILRHGRVVQSKGMGKRDGIFNLHAIARTDTPHRAGEITQAIRGKQSRLLKWGYKESARQMGLVMLYTMKFSRDTCRIDLKTARERLANSGELRQDLGSATCK